MVSQTCGSLDGVQSRTIGFQLEMKIKASFLLESITDAFNYALNKINRNLNYINDSFSIVIASLDMKNNFHALFLYSVQKK